MTMAVFTFIPDQPLTQPKRARVRSVSFGDGYSQDYQDGINNIDETLNLSFTLRQKTEIDAIDAFLTDKAGYVVFDFTGPSGVTKQYTCQEWTPVYNHDGNCSLTCTFKRKYVAA